MNNNQHVFYLRVMTPTGIIFDDDVTFLSIQTSEFRLGILPNHEPLIAAVKDSKMDIKQNDKVLSYSIGKGVLRIEKDGITTVLVEKAEALN